MSLSGHRTLEKSGIATLALLLWAGLTGLCAADVFELAGGGRLQGVWLNRDEPQEQEYQIQLLQGGRLVLAATAVKEVICEGEIRTQYQRRLVQLGDAVAEHWELAQWCRQHGLSDERAKHLRRILKLQPNHALARRALGHTFVQGRWLTQDQFMRERGYVRYRDRWELPQQIDLLEAQRKREVAQRQWYKQLTDWRRMMLEDASGKYYQAIATIDDPQAIVPLAQLLRQEVARPIRLLYVRGLAHIGTIEAEQCLVDVVLTDYDEEIVHGSLDRLAQHHDPAVLQRLLETLRHTNNFQVNRAALALERLGQKEAIGPLIDALTTVHAFPRLNLQSGQVELVPVELQNANVLTALTKLTDVAGYGYHSRVWKQWYHQQNHAAHMAEARITPVRRDDGGEPVDPAQVR